MKKSYPQLERYHRLKDEINARKRAYRATHNAEVNLKAKVYRDKNREAVRKYNSEYARNRNSREKILERALWLSCETFFGNCQNCPATPCPADISMEGERCQKRIINYYVNKAKEALK